MIKAVVDSSVFIDHLRGSDGARVFLKKVELREFIAYSSTVTEAELYSGRECDSIEKQARVGILLSATEKIQVSSEIAFKAGEFRRKYGVALLDALIAATAYRLKARIATKDKKSFSRIKEVSAFEPY